MYVDKVLAKIRLEKNGICSKKTQSRLLEITHNGTPLKNVPKIEMNMKDSSHDQNYCKLEKSILVIHTNLD